VAEMLPTIILECEIAAAQADKFIQDNGAFNSH